jgi:hypothetical protein
MSQQIINQIINSMLSKNNNNQQKVYEQINELIEDLEIARQSFPAWNQAFKNRGINLSSPDLNILINEYSNDIPSLRSVMEGILYPPQTHPSPGTQKALKATKSALKAKEAPALNANAKAKEAPALKPNAKQKLDPMMSTKVPTVALKAQVSSTVLPPISDSPIQINLTTEIPDQASDKKSIKITYGVKGNEYFLAEQIDPTILKSASLADATQASIDVTTKVTRQLGLTVPLASGIKVTRADASTTYDNTLKDSFESIQGQGIKKTKDSTDDSINTLLATVVGPTAVKAIMDSGCWGETFRLYLDADMFERTSITEDRIPGLLEVYISQPNGDNILSWLLKMSYCPVFELVSSDKLGAFNGLYTLNLLNSLFPVVATLNIPKGSGGQAGIYNEVYIYSIILAAVLTNTEIQTLFPPQAAIELTSVFSTHDIRRIVSQVKTITNTTSLNLNSFLTNVNEAMSSFSKNGGIAESIEEFNNIWSTNIFMYNNIPAFFTAIESVLNETVGLNQLTKLERIFIAIENSYFATNDQQKFIAVAEEFTWFAFQMTRYKKITEVYIDSPEGSLDLKRERDWYKQKLMANREKFESEWPKVLTKVYLNEAYFGHDNKSKTLTEYASHADPRVQQLVTDYKRDTKDNRSLIDIPWDNFEKWIIKKCQRENRCMVFEDCRVIEPKVASAASIGTGEAAIKITEAKTVPGISFGTNTDMGYNNTINYTVTLEQPTTKKETKKESFSAGGGNPVNTLLTKANIGCKVVVTTYDLENYVNPMAMYMQGAAEGDTMNMQYASNVILNELMRRRISDDKILEVQGILSTLDRASRTNNPGAIYATGHLLIPIIILEDPEMLLQITYMVGEDPNLKLWQESRQPGGELFKTQQAFLDSSRDQIDQQLLIQFTDLNYLISFMLSNAENKTDLTDKIRLESSLQNVFGKPKSSKKGSVELKPAAKASKPAEFGESLSIIFNKDLSQKRIDQATINAIAKVIQEMAKTYIDKFDVPSDISKGGQLTLSNYLTNNDFWYYYLTYMVGRNKKIAEIMYFYISNASTGELKPFTGDKKSQFEQILKGPDANDLALTDGFNFSQEVRLNAALFKIIGNLVQSRGLHVGETQGFFGEFHFGSDGKGIISTLSGDALQTYLISFFKENPDLWHAINEQLDPTVALDLSEAEAEAIVPAFVEQAMEYEIELANVGAVAANAVSSDPSNPGSINEEGYFHTFQTVPKEVLEQSDRLGGPLPMDMSAGNTFVIGESGFASLSSTDLTRQDSLKRVYNTDDTDLSSMSPKQPITDIKYLKDLKDQRDNIKNEILNLEKIKNEINDELLPLIQYRLKRDKIVNDLKLQGINYIKDPSFITLQIIVNKQRQKIFDLESDAADISNQINKLDKQNIILEQKINDLENPEELYYSQQNTPYRGGTNTNNSLKDLNGKPVIALYNKKEQRYYIISFEEYLKYWFNNQLEKIKKRNVSKGIKSTNLISNSEQKDPYGVLARREAVAARGIPRPVNNLSNLRQLPFGRKEMTLANFPQSQSIPGSALVQSSTNSIRSRGGKSKSKKNKQRKPNKKYTKRRNKKRFSNVRKTKKRLNKQRQTKRRMH